MRLDQSTLGSHVEEFHESVDSLTHAKNVKAVLAQIPNHSSPLSLLDRKLIEMVYKGSTTELVQQAVGILLVKTNVVPWVETSTIDLDFETDSVCLRP